MDLLDESLLKLNTNTEDIRSKDIQDLLIAIKKTSVNKECCEKILKKLWLHLETGLQEFDDQLLCSTCFYSVLNKSDNHEFYLRKMLEIMQYELDLKENVLEKSKISLAISLCYGIFQSTYLLEQSENINVTTVQTTEAIFNLLIQKGYEYTQYTFIAFKIMTFFKKVIGTKFQEIFLNKDNQIKLLNLINHNWENPITGVRNLNKIVFQNLLLILDQDIYGSIIEEINNFYWNKAKFLMLAEIIENSKTSIKKLVSENQWLDGLVYSLSKPGLVSAGADMYSAVLKKINSEETWTCIFLVKIIEALGGTCFKTIENFTNYWCLNTFKKFPSLLHALLDELNNINYTEYKLYSIICITKQGTKLGISRTTSLNFDELNMPESSISFLEHCNTSIRMYAFENICTSHQNLLPSETDYQLILNYLSDNVNSDCTVLRISMINNLKIFLDKLHVLYLNTIPKDNNNNIENMLTFCQNLQAFVVKSISIDGNYQRKITSIKFTQTIIKSFTEIKPRRKQQVREIKKSLVGFLQEKGFWKLNDKSLIMKLVDLLKDPASDVHEGVLQLLSEFYTTELSDSRIINYLIDEAKKCIASKFFYEISCGQIMFKLVINILSKTKNLNNLSKFKSVEDIFHYASSEINMEYAATSNVVKSIEDGKQLHSFLSILSIIFESSIRNSEQISIGKDTIFSLLIIVDCISNQFAWEDDLSTSSDFSKMSDMVENLIKDSGLKTENDDQTRISDLHQIVLNCLWLNVKASCELASLMIQYYKHDKDICEKCLNIITRVLETSRHKGAIEAAGTVLGTGIYCLTSQSDDLDVSKLPLLLLKNKLNELLFETSKMSSVTRRGAGLSIMVHRIVSNDHKKGKPLFHYFMKTLLDVCKNLNNTQNTNETLDTGNEKDVPKAIHLHFLTRIVTDSSLASDTMYYTAELAALAFDNLINDHWQIRNAALQLYGALIPKLIGQKKASGVDEETVATVACDEFRTHSPKLWEYIIKQIKEQDYEDVLQAHSNLVPILNVLASLAKRYNFSYDLKDQEKSDFNLLLHLLPLMGSPIYTVRRLTSQCIPNIYSLHQISKALENVQIFTQNYVHGVSMLMSNCYKTHSLLTVQVDKLSNKYQNILNQTNQTYMCKWILSKISKISKNITADLVKNILFEENRNKYQPGVSLWANTEIQNCLENMPWTVVPETLGLIMDTQEFDMYCDTLLTRINDNMQPPENVLSDIVKTLLSSQKTSDSSELWKVLYYLSLKIEIDDQNCNLKIIDEQIKNPSYKFRYVIPFATRIMLKQKNNNNLLILSKKIYSLCNPDSYDVDMRYIAALANNEFGNELQSYPDEVKINAIKSAVILLQDEDEDIRQLSVNFYKDMKNELKHPFICLNKILKYEFLCTVLNEPSSGIQIICKDLLHFIDQICKSKNNEYNPFSNDSKNIYLEKNLFTKTLQDISNMCS